MDTDVIKQLAVGDPAIIAPARNTATLRANADYIAKCNQQRPLEPDQIAKITWTEDTPLIMGSHRRVRAEYPNGHVLEGFEFIFERQHS